MVEAATRLAADWTWDCVSVGVPSPVHGGRVVAEPVNLGEGWVGFDYTGAFGKPTVVTPRSWMRCRRRRDSAPTRTHSPAASVSGTPTRLRKSWLSRGTLLVGEPFSSDGSRSRHPRGSRTFPQALAAEHAARQHLADDHRVATGCAEEPPTGGYTGRPELHVVPLVIGPHCGLGSIPRLVHLAPSVDLRAPAPCRSKEQQCQPLTPEPCPAANPEALLQRFVLLPVLDRRPHEEAEYDQDGRNRDDREDDLLSRVHALSLGRSRRLVTKWRRRRPALRWPPAVGFAATRRRPGPLPRRTELR